MHVKEALGHADLATTMGYTHLAKEHLRALVEQEPEREELRDLGHPRASCVRSCSGDWVQRTTSPLLTPSCFAITVFEYPSPK